MWGWAQGICSLLREETDRALAEFTEADGVMRALPSTGGVTGFLGPYLLLRTLRGATDWAELDGPGTERLTQVHWDRPFAGWSRAVLLGREGRAAEAAKAAEEALAGTDGIPLAAHLCLRLGAQAALADGWAGPWNGCAPPSSSSTTGARPACRPRAGPCCATPAPRAAPPPGPRRHPAGTAARGGDRPGVRGPAPARRPTRQPGDRRAPLPLPRTVEKHLASLRDRTGRPDRAALIALAKRYADEQ